MEARVQAWAQTSAVFHPLALDAVRCQSRSFTHLLLVRKHTARSSHTLRLPHTHGLTQQSSLSVAGLTHTPGSDGVAALAAAQ